MIKKQGVLILLLMLLLGGVAYAQNNFESTHQRGEEHIGNFFLDASVMLIDKMHDTMIVAEKVITLRVNRNKKGDNRYDTVFVNSTGVRISIDEFKPFVRVVVEGDELTDGKIIADKITLQ